MKVPFPQAKQGRVLADWVTASLREAILHGYFELGEKLDQDRIAEELDVSRTPVREAMRRQMSRVDRNVPIAIVGTTGLPRNGADVHGGRAAQLCKEWLGLGTSGIIAKTR